MAKEFSEIEKPKSPMTVYEFIETLNYENIKNEKILNNFVTDMNSRLNNIEETFSRMDKLFQKFNERMDLQETQTGYIERKALIEKTNQLKEEIVELKKENLSLKDKIKNLWNMFILIFKEKFTPTSQIRVSFFTKNKDAPLTCTFIDEKVNDSKTKP